MGLEITKWFVHWLSVMTIHIPTPSSELNDDMLRLMFYTLQALTWHVAFLWRQDFLSNCLHAHSRDCRAIVTQVWDSVGVGEWN